MPTFLKILITGILMIVYSSSSLAEDFWWDGNWNYRVSLTVDSGDYERSDRPAEVAIDFTSFLAPADLLVGFDVNSIRVQEVDVSGELLLSENISFQFDPAADFDALSNAQGTLIFLLDGNTAAQTNRYFQVYFDVAGSGYTLPAFTNQVIVTDNIPDEGQDSFLISTFNADYYYQKLAGGFSSIIDDDGNDWINYHPTGGTAGNYRGIPNLVSPGNGGHFHPGATTSNTTLVHEGPLKATIKSTTTDGLWEVQWEFFPQFARMTVLRAETSYWFLYEGTPGGLFDVNDFVTRSNGVETGYLKRWKADLPAQEWAYLSDTIVDRSIFFAHHEDDVFIDSYRQLHELMTVFGFGRDGNASLLQSQNNQFTIGLTDTTDFTNTSLAIESAYKDISIFINGSDQYDDEAPTSPGNLNGQSTSTTVGLTWDAAIDNAGVALYRISRDGAEIGTTTGISFQVTGLTPGQNYGFSVVAQDTNGNLSSPSTISITTQQLSDNTPPSTPAGLTLNSATENAVTFSWAASTDDLGDVANYRIFRDGTEVGTSNAASFTDTTVQADQTYQYTVSAIDDAGNESNTSITLQVITPLAPDTEAPNIPTGLTLDSVSTNAVGISWISSTDTQGTVTLYHIMRDGNQIGTTSVAYYTDSTVAADTSYVYNVTAEDNTGNESAVSADLNVNTTIPSGLELLGGYAFEEGAGLAVLDLSGNGNNGTLRGNATRNLTGKPGESIEFNSSTSHINLGTLDITTPTMSISLWFKADDFGTHDARLISKASGTASSAHYWMVSTIRKSGQKRLRFRLKTDNGGTSTLIGNAVLTAGQWTHVTATYDGAVMKLYQDGTEVGSLAKTGIIETSDSVEAWIGANPGNARYFDGLIDDVRIYGEALDVATIQNIISGNLPLISNDDIEAPTSPSSLAAQPTSTLVDLTWNAATDNVGVMLYRVLRDGNEVGTAIDTLFQATGLNSGQNYDFSVIAQDTNGNQSTPATVFVTTLSADTEAPSVPTGLIEDSATASIVAISWDASTDTQGIVASYRIFRDGTEVGTSASILFTDTTVQSDQAYQYTVSAIDDAGNESNPSATLQVITLSSSDTEAPSIPTSLTLNSVSANAVSFSWTPSTDTQGTVVFYHVLRDGSEIGTTSVASYTDNTVVTDIAYVYNVTAEDNASNESTISADLNVDTTVPSGPALLAGYAFEESSGQSILDLSGNGNNGILEGNAIRSLTGQPGESIEFNGSTGRINLGPMDITTPTMSISLWFKADGFGTHDARLISKAAGTASSAHYWMVSTIRKNGQKRLRFRLKTDNGGTSTLIGNAALTAGQWTHVTATYDGLVMKLYQDGVEVGSLAKTGTIATSASVEVWIGANPDNARYFDGLIDDVRIYGEALDVTTILEIISGNLPINNI